MLQINVYQMISHYTLDKNINGHLGVIAWLICLIGFVPCHAVNTNYADSLNYTDSMPDDDIPDSDAPSTLYEIVVTGTRSPRLLKDSPVQVRLIDTKQIRRADAVDIKGVLQQEIPGVEFSYAMDRQVHLNLGGFGGQGILFLVDGERLAGETMDDVDFTRLEMSDTERIEIVRGASSALYGSSAGGGVVNILSREPDKPWQINVNARIGRHLEQRYGVSMAVRRGRVSNTLSASHTSMKSYDLVNGATPETSVVSEVLGYKTYNIKDRLKVNLSDNIDVTARAGYFMRQIPDDSDNRRRYRDYSGGLRGHWNMSRADNLEVSYAFDQYDKSSLNRVSGRDVRSYSNVQNSVRMLYNHSFAPGHLLTAGADYMYDYLLNNNMAGQSHTQQSADFFGQYDHIFSKSFEVVGALRYDYYKVGKLSRLTPKISACWRPTRRMAVRASYGMGYRVPSLKEMYYDFDMAGIWIVRGNPALRPEHSHNVNASVEYIYRQYNITAMGYYNHVTDRIATSLPYYMPDDPRQLYLDYVNLDRYDVAGCELSLQGIWDCGLSASMSYAYTHEGTARDKNGSATASQYLPARPHSLVARVGWDHSFSSEHALAVGLNARLYGGVSNDQYIDYYDIQAGMKRVHYPAYAICRLNATASLCKRVDLSLTIDNLLDYKPRYYYLNSPMTDGINIIAGVNITID